MTRRARRNWTQSLLATSPPLSEGLENKTIEPPGHLHLSNLKLLFIMSVSTLVKAQWLRQMMLQKSKYLRVLDTSWHLPKENRDPKKEFLAHRIPGAKFFDIEECVDKSSPYEHMLPKTEDFSNYVRSLGLKNDSHVVVYDNNNGGLFSAPRVWWMLRAFGHDRVSILDGGFTKWCAEGYPVEYGPENTTSVEGMWGRGRVLLILIIRCRGVGGGAGVVNLLL